MSSPSGFFTPLQFERVLGSSRDSRIICELRNNLWTQEDGTILCHSQVTLEFFFRNSTGNSLKMKVIGIDGGERGVSCWVDFRQFFLIEFYLSRTCRDTLIVLKGSSLHSWSMKNIDWVSFLVAVSSSTAYRILWNVPANLGWSNSTTATESVGYTKTEQWTVGALPKGSLWTHK